MHLEFGVGVEHDVLAAALYTLGPAGQPGDRVVVSHLFPFVTSRRFWDSGISAEIRSERAVNHKLVNKRYQM